jgi:voltage-gated potassium channel
MRRQPNQAASKPSIYSIGTSGHVLWQVFVLAASVLSVILLGATLAPGITPAVMELLRELDAFVCGIFITDFIVQMRREPDRWKYFRTWGWIDILSSVPLLVEPHGFGHLVRLFRIVRIIRVLKSGKFRFEGFLYNPAQATLFTIGMLFMIVVTLSSTAMLMAEEHADSHVNTAGDALWWCMATLTTVGYGDVVPATAAGRIIAVLTMLSGIAVFSTFTAFVASTFLAVRQSRTMTPGQLESLIERLDRIEAGIERRNAGTDKNDN